MQRVLILARVAVAVLLLLPVAHAACVPGCSSAPPSSVCLDSVFAVNGGSLNDAASYDGNALPSGGETVCFGCPAVGGAVYTTDGLGSFHAFYAPQCDQHRLLDIEDQLSLPGDNEIHGNFTIRFAVQLLNQPNAATWSFLDGATLTMDQGDTASTPTDYTGWDMSFDETSRLVITHPDSFVRIRQSSFSSFGLIYIKTFSTSALVIDHMFAAAATDVVHDGGALVVCNTMVRPDVEFNILGTYRVRDTIVSGLSGAQSFCSTSYNGIAVVNAGALYVLEPDIVVSVQASIPMLVKGTVDVRTTQALSHSFVRYFTLDGGELLLSSKGVLRLEADLTVTSEPSRIRLDRTSELWIGLGSSGTDLATGFVCGDLTILGAGTVHVSDLINADGRVLVSSRLQLLPAGDQEAALCDATIAVGSLVFRGADWRTSAASAQVLLQFRGCGTAPDQYTSYRFEQGATIALDTSDSAIMLQDMTAVPERACEDTRFNLFVVCSEDEPCFGTPEISVEDADLGDRCRPIPVPLPSSGAWTTLSLVFPAWPDGGRSACPTSPTQLDAAVPPRRVSCDATVLLAVLSTVAVIAMATAMIFVVRSTRAAMQQRKLKAELDAAETTTVVSGITANTVITTASKLSQYGVGERPDDYGHTLAESGESTLLSELSKDAETSNPDPMQPAAPMPKALGIAMATDAASGTKVKTDEDDTGAGVTFFRVGVIESAGGAPQDARSGSRGRRRNSKKRSGSKGRRASGGGAASGGGGDRKARHSSAGKRRASDADGRRNSAGRRRSGGRRKSGPPRDSS